MVESRVKLVANLKHTEVRQSLAWYKGSRLRMSAMASRWSSFRPVAAELDIKIEKKDQLNAVNLTWDTKRELLIILESFKVVLTTQFKLTER